MIKVNFYDYGCELEGTDNVCDLADNQIFWFSAKNEAKCIQKIKDVLNLCIRSN